LVGVGVAAAAGVVWFATRSKPSNPPAPAARDIAAATAACALRTTGLDEMGRGDCKAASESFRRALAEKCDSPDLVDLYKVSLEQCQTKTAAVVPTVQPSAGGGAAAPSVDEQLTTVETALRDNRIAAADVALAKVAAQPNLMATEQARVAALTSQLTIARLSQDAGRAITEGDLVTAKAKIAQLEQLAPQDTSVARLRELLKKKPAVVVVPVRRTTGKSVKSDAKTEKPDTVPVVVPAKPDCTVPYYYDGTKKVFKPDCV